MIIINVQKICSFAQMYYNHLLISKVTSHFNLQLQCAILSFQLHNTYIHALQEWYCQFIKCYNVDIMSENSCIIRVNGRNWLHNYVPARYRRWCWGNIWVCRKKFRIAINVLMNDTKHERNIGERFVSFQ